MSYFTPSAYDAILAREGMARHKRAAAVLLMVVLIVVAMALTGLLDPRRFADAWPAIKQLSREMFPPDFGRYKSWLRPLADTLAMSVAERRWRLRFRCRSPCLPLPTRRRIRSLTAPRGRY
jgi:phosphonate transport system permease protein